MVKITLSTSEMNGDNVTVICSDASGAEWRDVIINIQTSAQQIDDLATQASVNTVDDFLDTEIAAIKAKTDNLPASPAAVGDIPTAAVVADAVWDEATTGHETAGSFGQANLNGRSGTAQAGAAGTITLDASASAVDDFYNGMWIYLTAGSGAGQVRLITDYVGSTKVATVSPNWATNPSSSSVFQIRPTASVAVGAGGIAASAFAAGALDAAALATDAVTEIQAGLATAAALTIVDDFLDTEIAAIKAKTDNLPAAPAAVSDIPTAAVVADAVWDEAISGHTTSGTFGQGAQTTRQGTAQAGAAGTITLDASASATDDFYNGLMVYLTGGTGAGQARLITDYVGSTKVATVQPNWTTNPSSSSVFVVMPKAHDLVASDSLTSIAAAVWDRLTSALSTASSIGKLLVDNINATISSRATQTSVDTIDDFVDTEVASILAAVDTEVAAIKAKTDNLPASPAAVGDIPTAAAIADAVLDDPIPQPSGVFAWSSTLRNIAGWLGAVSRNKMTQTDTTSTLRNDADNADLATSTISDDGTVFTRGEWS